MSVELLPQVKLTKTQKRLFEVLSDGEPHSIDSLLPCIDTLADKYRLQDHITTLRSVIFHSGYLIAGHARGTRGIVSYQLVRRLKVSLD